MQYKLLNLAALILSASQVGAELSAPSVVESIEKITDLSTESNSIAKDLAAGSDLVDNGLKLVSSLREMVVLTTQDVADVAAATEQIYTKSDASVSSKAPVPKPSAGHLGALGPLGALGGSLGGTVKGLLNDITPPRPRPAAAGSDGSKVKLIGGLPSVTKSAPAPTGTPKLFTMAEQQEVCNSFNRFFIAHGTLLKTIMTKKDLLAGTPLTAPIAALMHLIEDGVDKLTVRVTTLVPACAVQARLDVKKLDTTVEELVHAYNILPIVGGALDDDDDSSSDNPHLNNFLGGLKTDTDDDTD